MVAWLSDWLRDIIAVILLAGLVELLLPNKAMQRYARLVVGLFILLTILSPILSLIQGDISSKLNEGMEQWSKMTENKSLQMASLDQIEKNAERMKEKQEIEAASLTERTLEDTMRRELIERTPAKVKSVDAQLNWIVQSGRKTPYINQVIVTLESDDRQVEGDSESDSSAKGQAVEDVLPVAVDIDLDLELKDENATRQTIPTQSETSTDEEASATNKQQAAEERWTQADPETAAAINRLIVQGWGVDMDKIVVRQPSLKMAAR